MIIADGSAVGNEKDIKKKPLPFPFFLSVQRTNTTCMSESLLMDY